jgi:hypothetical protein
LRGRGSGGYEGPFGFPDAGRGYVLHGEVNLGGLGHFGVSGSLHSLGFIMRGRAGGELTFSNARGSLTLRLEGPEQPGFSPLPGTFHYQVVAATGAYHGLHEGGALHLALHQAPGEAVASHGTFTLSLSGPGRPQFGQPPRRSSRRSRSNRSSRSTRSSARTSRSSSRSVRSTRSARSTRSSAWTSRSSSRSRRTAAPPKTHALPAGSPATDQRGVARPRDGDGDGVAIVDVGAFEL